MAEGWGVYGPRKRHGCRGSADKTGSRDVTRVDRKNGSNRSHLDAGRGEREKTEVPFRSNSYRLVRLARDRVHEVDSIGRRNSFASSPFSFRDARELGNVKDIHISPKCVYTYLCMYMYMRVFRWLVRFFFLFSLDAFEHGQRARSVPKSSSLFFLLPNV